MTLFVCRPRSLVFPKSKNHFSKNARLPNSKNTRAFSTAKQKCYLGIDEAGLGPMLGPLSVIRVAASTENYEQLTKAFAEANTGVGDSKKVHVTGDMVPIEMVGLAGINWLAGGKAPTNASDFFLSLGEKPEDRAPYPWMSGAEDLKLPFAATEVPRWNFHGVEPLGYSGIIVHPPALNSARNNGINKASLELDYIGDLLKNLPKGFDEYEIFVDRLGGRKYYAESLQKFWPNGEITVVEEVPKISSYTVATPDFKLNIKFMVSGEDKTAIVAVASCIAKYVRELHMHLFNKYWSGKYPRVRPTDGYYRDGKRWINSMRKADRFAIPPIAEQLIRAGQETRRF